MNVEILYFAGARDITGRRNERVALPEAVNTVAAFFTWLIERHPELGPYGESLRIARNETFAEPTEVVTEGDVLAIIPPVAGG